eukprot:gene6247-6966_t
MDAVTFLNPNTSLPDLGSSLSSLSNEEASIYGQPNPFRVKAKGKGLESGHTNQPCFFTLDARKAGYGDFDILVKGPSQADIVYHDQDDDTLYTVEFRVALPGDYSIEIKYDSKHIPGSPFGAKITSLESPKTESTKNESNSKKQNNGGKEPSSGNSSRVVNGDINSVDREKKRSRGETWNGTANGMTGYLQGYVTSPSGDIFTTSLTRNTNGTFAVQFPRNEIGTYLVNVVNPVTGKCIAGCPFKVRVESQADEEPKVYGTGLEHCQVGETGMFSVKGTQNFKFEDLAVAFEGSYLSNTKVFKNFYDSIDFLYVPSRPGCYRIHINYRGQKISGSPYRLIVKNRRRSKGNIEAPTEPGSVNLLVWLGMDLASTVNTEVLGPNESCVPHSFVVREKNLYEIRFFPKDIGGHTVKIQTDPVSGKSEEFHLTMQNMATEATQKFPTINVASSLSDVQVDKPGKIVIDIPTGIPNHLTVQFHGPGQIDSQRIEGGMNQIQIHYRAKIPGSYLVSINYEGVPVKGSPYQIRVADMNGNQLSIADEATGFCSCHGKGLQEAKAGVISNFIVDACNAGLGSLMVGFDDPDVSATEVVSKHMGNCVYDVQYCIEKDGVYELTVMWGGKHVPGSPFKVNVR